MSTTQKLYRTDCGNQSCGGSWDHLTSDVTLANPKPLDPGSIRDTSDSVFPDIHHSGQGPAGLIVENPRLTSLSPIWMHFCEIRTYEIARYVPMIRPGYVSYRLTTCRSLSHKHISHRRASLQAGISQARISYISYRHASLAGAYLKRRASLRPPVRT